MQHHLVFSWYPGPFSVVRLHCVRRRVRVDPLLDFDFAGAVGDLVCDVCGLRADIEHLAYEHDAGRVCAVYLVVRLWVGLGGVEGLFDCNRPEGVVVGIATLFFFSNSQLSIFINTLSMASQVETQSLNSLFLLGSRSSLQA